MKIKNEGVDLRFDFKFSTIKYFKENRMIYFHNFIIESIQKQINLIAQEKNIILKISKFTPPNKYQDTLLIFNFKNINDAVIMNEPIRKELQKLQRMVNTFTIQQVSELNTQSRLDEFNILWKKFVENNSIEQNYKQLNKILDLNSITSVKKVKI